MCLVFPFLHPQQAQHPPVCVCAEQYTVRQILIMQQKPRDFKHFFICGVETSREGTGITAPEFHGVMWMTSGLPSVRNLEVQLCWVGLGRI